MWKSGFRRKALEIGLYLDQQWRRSARTLRLCWTLTPFALALALGGPRQASTEDHDWPKRVLITNDNGVDDAATLALARAFARFSDVVLVAPAEDRSGTSNLMSFFRTRKFVAERRDVGEGVRAWALEGYPADCVIFALVVPMADAPPDLVVSGINGGTNTADAWFGSGTIGAARTAAFAGIPAIAVSGVDDSDPDAIDAVSDWVVRLARSEIMQGLRPPSYLTVSLPVVPPSQITGIDFVDRARGILGVTVQRDSTSTPGSAKEVWSVDLALRGDPGSDSDVATVKRGHIAVVPMRIGDADPELLAWLRSHAGRLPAWRPDSNHR
jgi:5'-nucleotidase